MSLFAIGVGARASCLELSCIPLPCGLLQNGSDRLPAPAFLVETEWQSTCGPCSDRHGSLRQDCAPCWRT